MHINFTILDAAAVALAVLIFPLFIVVPGYVIGTALDLASFRKRSLVLRFVLSLVLSLSLTPIIAYLAAREGSIIAVWFFFGVTWASFAVLLWRQRRMPIHSKTGWIIAAVSAVWITVTIASLVDIELSGKLFSSAVSYDYTVRSAVVSQIGRANWLPPSSPFFFPGHAAPLRYHYFWFMMCSFPPRLMPSLIGSRHGLFAGVAWVGLALMATVALFLRLFQDRGASDIRKRTMIALGLLCLTGLDILPTLYADLSHFVFHVGSINPSVDWWNPDQVTGWLDSLLWVPHHVAGLIAGMGGFLILWVERARRIRWQVILAGGLAFASMVGLSVYVGLTFAIFLCVWCVVTLFRREYPQLITLVFVGILSVLLSAPFVSDLAAAGSAGTTGTGASFIKLGIRMFQPAMMALRALHLNGAATGNIVNFLFLPVNFFFELGVFFVILVIGLRAIVARRNMLPSELAAVVMLGTSFFVAIFLRSNTIETNDLGMRSMLLVQFIAVIWGADLIAARQRLGTLLLCCIVLGAATNIYSLSMLRGYNILIDSGFDPGTNVISPGKDFAARALATREAYEWLQTNVPRNAVEQHDPAQGYDPLPGLYANRQMAMSNSSSAAAFGGDLTESAIMLGALGSIFTDRKASSIQPTCEKYRIDYLISRSEEPAWRDSASWVWKREPLYANRLARVFSCGGSRNVR